jgi:hypothetical protein
VSQSVVSEPSPQSEPADEAAESIFGKREDRSRLHRALVVLAPLGLALNIVLSLWVSYLHVRRSAIVQVETQWSAGERLAVRAQLVDARLGGVEGTRAWLELRHRGDIYDLGQIDAVELGGLTQGFIDVPQVEAGPAELEIDLFAPGYESLHETIPIEIVERRQSRAGEHVVSTSMLQWADDTDPQPERLRIDLRPFGRLLAGFDNEFMARITDLDGKPWHGPVEGVLIHGEFAGEVGSEEDPPTLFDTQTDSLGLVAVGGPLNSDVVRIEIRAKTATPAEPSTEEGGDPPSTEEGGDTTGAEEPAVAPETSQDKRRFRYVSYPGGVRVEIPTLAARPGGELELLPRSLRRKRPIFVDLHDPDGGWIDSLMPPFHAGQEARSWKLPDSITEGFVQIEAYHYTNDPGEGTALARVYVSEHDPSQRESLLPLIERQRAMLEVPRLDKAFDVEREHKYLAHLEKAQLTPAEVSKARHWLMGSLPIEVYGPPTALMTQLRDEEALAIRKERWTVGLRWFMWGGGLLFILIFAVSILRADSASARKIAQALNDDDEQDGTMAQHLMMARRSMLFRGGIVVGIMVATLVLAVMLMENLVWVA